jgi:hypothetical protein
MKQKIIVFILSSIPAYIYFSNNYSSGAGMVGCGIAPDGVTRLGTS